MSNNELGEGTILGLGNPLLDLSAIVTDELLEKYDLQANNAILAGDKQADLPKDLADNFKVDYIAGGAIQNSIRVAQWFFDRPHVTTFFGAIGRDKFGEQMGQKAEQDGVRVLYQIDPEVPTGTCACLITDNGKKRSLCAFLGASQKFTIKHIKDNIGLVEKARLFYTSGFHLLVSLESSLFLAEHSLKAANKRFILNLSAPYISQFYSKELLAIIPYTDILFGNETEAQAFADMKGWETKDLEVIAQKIADLEHLTPSRTVVITQGKDDILVATTDCREPLRRFPVPVLSDLEIVDTNGAGDSFVGGYLAMLAQGRSLPESIKAGIYAAVEIIKMNGCSLPKDNAYRINKL